VSGHLHALPEGTELEGYRIERVLGVGGFAITYLGRDIEIGKLVAIKEYLPNEFAVRAEGTTVLPKSGGDLDDYTWGLERFLDEARTLATFDHPHLNKVFRFFKANGTAYMVLEYIEGETLSERLRRDGSMPAHELAALLDDLLAGLAVVHRNGFVHRDIKPGNIMLRPEGGAVLLDFGAARAALGQRSKSITAILTPGYAPVEQYDQHADDVGPWTDIYALGMVAYRCIRGCRDAELLDAVGRARLQRKGEFHKDLPPAVEVGQGRYEEGFLAAVDWAIQVNEEDRPTSVAAWRAALLGEGGDSASTAPCDAATRRVPATGRETVRSRRVAEPPVAGRPAGGRKPLLLTVVASLLLAAAGGAGWYVSDLQNTAETAAVTEYRPLAARAESAAPVEVQPPQAEVEAVRRRQREAQEKALQEAQKKARIESLLEAADRHFAARRYTTPPDDNAAVQYKQVLVLDPDNARARTGLDNIVAAYIDMAGLAMAQQAFGKAKQYLARAEAVDSQAPQLAAAFKHLAKVQAEALERQRREAGRRQQQEAERQAKNSQQQLRSCKRKCSSAHFLCTQKVVSEYQACVSKAAAKCEQNQAACFDGGRDDAFGGDDPSALYAGGPGCDEQVDCQSKARIDCSGAETTARQACTRELRACTEQC